MQGERTAKTHEPPRRHHGAPNSSSLLRKCPSAERESGRVPTTAAAAAFRLHRPESNRAKSWVPRGAGSESGTVRSAAFGAFTPAASTGSSDKTRGPGLTFGEAAASVSPSVVRCGYCKMNGPGTHWAGREFLPHSQFFQGAVMTMYDTVAAVDPKMTIVCHVPERNQNATLNARTRRMSALRTRLRFISGLLRQRMLHS